MGETPFPMTFETKAVILVEVGLTNMRVSNFSPNNNNAFMTE